MTRLPLSAGLSQVLVAFTIEFDNDLERQMPHRTTRSPPASDRRGAPRLVSTVMWSTLTRYVGDDSVAVAQLPGLACITKESAHSYLAGMERLGYVVVEPDPGDSRPKPPLSAWIVQPTAAGKKARGPCAR